MQVADELVGAYSSSTCAIGSIFGLVGGNVASITINMATPGCSGKYSGTAIIKDVSPQTNPEMMSFQYKGQTTCGGNESGTATLTKK